MYFSFLNKKMVQYFYHSFATLFMLTMISTKIDALKFDRSEVGSNGFQADPIKFVDRMYVPYGPDLVATPPQASASQPWSGYGYGLGATEHWAYDYKERYIYSQSEAGGYITVIDWSALPGTVTPYSLDVCGENCDVRDIAVCSEQGLLFLTRTDRNDVLIYSTVKRSAPAIPMFLEQVRAGNSPDAIKLSNDCRILAVANQNEGTDKINLGAVTLVTNFWPSDEGDAIAQTVSFAQFDESYLLGRDVHLPLTKKSATYWNTEAYDSDEPTYGWEGTNGFIEKFNPAITMDPEFFAFNENGSELYVNLQQNSALVRVDTSTGVAQSVDGYGLKHFGASSLGVDIVKDGQCTFVTSECLYLSRTPDAIATVDYEGTQYILTADEGSDFDIGPFEEVRDTADLFGVNATFLHSGFTFDPSFFVPGDSTAGCTANFQADCEDNLAAGLVDWCSNLEVTIGSSAVNYDTVGSPKMNKIVGIGGRGIAIFRLPSDPTGRMTQVFDSGSQFEKETCSKYPWAQNAVMDEEFAPACEENNILPETCPAWILADEDDRGDLSDMNDPDEDGCASTGGACPMSETIDEKAEEDGLAVEVVVVGIACDHLVAIACGENNGICLLYDITDIESPEILKTFHTSEVSRTKNPEQTYRKDLGDLDSETIVWIPPSRSPTGKSGFLLGGAISGTLSFYEFQCKNTEDKCFPDGCNIGSSQKLATLSNGTIAGISVAVVAAVLVGGFVVKNMRSSQGRSIESNQVTITSGAADGGSNRMV